jgi:DNA-binding NarL/FixJ family response regulator
MLTSFHLEDYLYEVPGARASGFLLKVATAADLVRAVQVVAAGDALLTRRRPPAHRGLRPPPPASLGALTSRETEALRLIARGPSNAQISDTVLAIRLAGEAAAAAMAVTAVGSGPRILVSGRRTAG